MGTVLSLLLAIWKVRTLPVTLPNSSIVRNMVRGRKVVTLGFEQSQVNSFSTPKRHDATNVSTDKSNLAWGVTSVTQKAMGFFDAEERELRIAWKEFSAVTRALESQAPSPQGQRVLLMKHNQVVHSIVNKGTSKFPQLMKEYRAIFFLLCKFNIRLPAHITEHQSRFSSSSGPTLIMGGI